MGEIKFDAARMQEVLNRLDEIQEQLTQATNTNSEKLSSVSGNIEGELVVGTLNKYTEKTLEITEEIIKLSNKLIEYLGTQLSKYTTTETNAQESLTEIQTILSQLEGGV